MQGEKIVQLQSLRFFAAAFVLVGHVLMETQQQRIAIVPVVIYNIPWGAGVDLFFVISGFIIYYISPTGAHGLGAARDFLIKRVIRIAPMYWIFTLLMIVASIAFSTHLEHHDVTIFNIIKSFLFIPFIPDGSKTARPILAQGWTLNYEILFYILFAFVIMVPRFRAALIVSALTALVLIGSVFGPFDGVTNFFFEPILLEFVAGVLLAANRHRLPALSTPASAMIVGAGLLWFAFMPQGDPFNGWLRLWERGVPAVLIVLATLQIGRAPSPFAKGVLPLLGDASYALYLSHTFAVNALVIAWARVGLNSPPLFFAMAIVVPIALSVALLLLFERPLLRSMNLAFQNSRIARRQDRELRGDGVIVSVES